MNIHIHIHTFGCKLNINESENIKSNLVDLGYNFTSLEKAHCVIVNTCTVTKQSDDKIEKYLLKIRNEFAINDNFPIFLIGCYVSKKSYENHYKNTIIIKNDDKENAADIINSYLKEHDETQEQNVLCSENTAQEQNENDDDKSRYFLKIQDGCNVFCTYCIIAFVRGRVRSIAPSIIVDNINKAKEMGYREIVFTGINIASYKYDNIDFITLIEQYVLSILEKNNMRLRISSIEPFLFTDDVISLFANKNICPHVHIPLQSASDKILALMNRRYTKNDYKAIIKKIHALDRDILITTDVMVGFPDESDSDFNETVELANKIKFFKMHIFRYSKREGTKAYSYENQVGYRTKLKRAKLLNEINNQMSRYYASKFIDKHLEVVIEKKLDSNQYFGTSGQYLKVKIIDAQTMLDKKMLVSGKCFAVENNILIVKYEKIL